MKNYEFILIEKLLNIEANPNRVMIILSFHFLYFFLSTVFIFKFGP